MTTTCNWRDGDQKKNFCHSDEKKKALIQNYLRETLVEKIHKVQNELGVNSLLRRTISSSIQLAVQFLN